MTYDNAGNLTNDTYTGAGSRAFDAENRMTQAWGGANQQQFYTYNADGQRVRRKIDGVETWQIYGMDGELLAEYAANAAAGSPQKEYGYRNGQLLVTAEAPAGINVALAANGPPRQRHRATPGTRRAGRSMVIARASAVARTATGTAAQLVSRPGCKWISTARRASARSMCSRCKTITRAPRSRPKL